MVLVNIMVKGMVDIMFVKSLTYLDFVVYSHTLGHYHGQCLGHHYGQRHGLYHGQCLGLHHGQCLGLHHGCHKSCRSWQLCRAVNHDSGRSPARRLCHIMLCHQQEDYDGDDDRDDHRNNDNDDYEDDNEDHGSDHDVVDDDDNQEDDDVEGDDGHQLLCLCRQCCCQRYWPSGRLGTN